MASEIVRYDVPKAGKGIVEVYNGDAPFFASVVLTFLSIVSTLTLLGYGISDDLDVQTDGLFWGLLFPAGLAVNVGISKFTSKYLVNEKDHLGRASKIYWSLDDGHKSMAKPILDKMKTVAETFKDDDVVVVDVDQFQYSRIKVLDNLRWEEREQAMEKHLNDESDTFSVQSYLAIAPERSNRLAIERGDSNGRS